MKPPCKKPCKECPFRRKSLPGYLGNSNALQFMATTIQNDSRMPCHSTVNYRDPNWEATLEAPKTKVRQCAGAAIFFANINKLPRDRAIGRLPPSTDVMGSFDEFFARHTRLKPNPRIPGLASQKRDPKRETLATQGYYDWREGDDFG